jgi:hypothetical protein
VVALYCRNRRDSADGVKRPDLACLDDYDRVTIQRARQLSLEFWRAVHDQDLDHGPAARLPLSYANDGGHREQRVGVPLEDLLNRESALRLPCHCATACSAAADPSGDGKSPEARGAA